MQIPSIDKMHSKSGFTYNRNVLTKPCNVVKRKQFLLCFSVSEPLNPYGAVFTAVAQNTVGMYGECFVRNVRFPYAKRPRLFQALP